MRARATAFLRVVLTLALLAPAAPSLAVSSGAEDLSDLARHLETLGLAPLPGQTALEVEGGVVGLFRGSPDEDEAKQYLLVLSGPSGIGAVERLAEVGKRGVVLEEDGIEMSPAFADLDRHVIVACWDDLETVGEAVVPLDEVAAHLDLSGIHPGAFERLAVRATGSSPVWNRLLERTNIPLGLDLRLDVAPDLGAPRAGALFGRGIPGLQLVTESSESPDAVMSAGSAAAFAALLASKVSRLEAAPAFQRFEPESAQPQKASARPYTGTIPDYADDVEGLRLGGVLEGGPAEEAGLQEGDVIVELAGVVIKDVYVYAEALDALEIDVPVSITVVREGERLEMSLTPRGRE